MSTLEDKILGEKRDYYCSSSEDEGKEDEDDGTSGGGRDGSGPGLTQTHALAAGSSSSNPQQRWDGVSRNTGPKGVLEDWYLFQKHEEQMRLNKEHELIAMVERASMTCLPENGTDVVQVLPDKDELESDSILQDFIKQRMEAMLQAQAQMKQFGGVEELLSADEYLKLVDDKESKITIVLHIYDNSISQCVKMNECLASISGEYRHVRFCKMKAGVAGVSNFFKLQGIPALLVYQGGELIGNFVRLKEEFGDEFYAGDVENYLIENGILSSSKT